MRWLGGLFLCALAFGAPEDEAARLLRRAWASQYEWREDAVKNVTLEFTYSFAMADPDRRATGTGQVVLVGNEIVRRHYPDADDKLVREEIDSHVGWVLDRFVRKPFEEEFKDTRFEGPVPSANGWQKITAGRRVFYVKDDRIAALEMRFGPPQRPIVTLIEVTTEKLGGGYTIVGTSGSYTDPRDATKVEWRRALTTKLEQDIPAPAVYEYHARTGKSLSDITIQFPTLRFNLPDPVTLDPAARDLLKAAWEKRYTLPDDTRLQGEFRRTLDRDLERAGFAWVDDLRGEFQLWGMDRLQIALDEEYQERRWFRDVQESCLGQLRGIFDQLRAIPFAEEFKGCGFELQPEGKDSIVRVYGYGKAEAFRVSGEAIVGHFSKVGNERGWWEYKVKRTSEGTFLLEHMKREIEGKRYDLEYRYQRAKGLQVPKKVDVFVAAASQAGVASYAFSKVKVR